MSVQYGVGIAQQLLRTYLKQAKNNSWEPQEAKRGRISLVCGDLMLRKILANTMMGNCLSICRNTTMI